MTSPNQLNTETLRGNRDILRMIVSLMPGADFLKSIGERANHTGVKVGVAGLALLSLAGCTQSESHNTIRTPAPVETSDPGTQSPDFSPTGEIPSQYANLDTSDPTSISEGDQLIYSSWLEQNAAAYDARYDRVAGGEATPLPKVSINNTAVEILALYNNDIRMASSFSENGDGKTEDVQATLGAILAAHDSPNSAMETVVGDLEDQMLDGKVESADEAALQNRYPDITEDQVTSFSLKTNLDKSQSAYISFVDNEDNKQAWVFNYVTSPDYNGTPNAGDKWVRAN
ncbi:MAG: hypothetical protein JWM52_508 [Candidatus Saccharibacteria bacterium]|nr:hypothetical protein [Candidatus Saccharibacteria bacterium]